MKFELLGIYCTASATFHCVFVRAVHDTYHNDFQQAGLAGERSRPAHLAKSQEDSCTKAA